MAEAEQARFVVHLEGSGEPEVESVLGLIEHTAKAARQIADLAVPNSHISVRISDLRRGCLGIGFILAAGDYLAAASPTAHLIAGAAFLKAIELMANRLISSASEPPRSEAEQVAARALKNPKFRKELAAAFEATLGDKNVTSIAVSRDFDGPKITLPVGYFHDRKTGLALPEDTFRKKEVISLSQRQLFVDRGTTATRNVHWMQNGRLVSAPCSIQDAEIVRRADKGTHGPIAVVNLKVEQYANTISGRTTPIRAHIEKVIQMMPE